MIPLVFATPSGFRALTYVANHFRMPYLRPLQEYRHAQWPLDGPFFFLVAGLLLATLLPLLHRRRPSLVPTRVLLPCAALGILGGLRIRFVAEFAMLAGPALAVAFTRLLPRLAGPWPARIAGGLFVVLTGIPRVVSGARRRARLRHRTRSGSRAHGRHRLRRKEWAARAHVQRSRGRLVPDLAWLAALPRVSGSAHQRLPGFFHAILRRADLTRAEWQSLLDSFGVTSALVTFPSVNPRGALFDPSLWALVYRANDGLVFVRRPARDDLLRSRSPSPIPR